MLSHLRNVWLFTTLWTVATGFMQPDFQAAAGGLPCPPQGEAQGPSLISARGTSRQATGRTAKIPLINLSGFRNPSLQKSPYSRSCILFISPFFMNNKWPTALPVLPSWAYRMRYLKLKLHKILRYMIFKNSCWNKKLTYNAHLLILSVQQDCYIIASIHSCVYSFSPIMVVQAFAAYKQDTIKL